MASSRRSSRMPDGSSDGVTAAPSTTMQSAANAAASPSDTMRSFVVPITYAFAPATTSANNSTTATTNASIDFTARSMVCPSQKSCARLYHGLNLTSAPAQKRFGSTTNRPMSESDVCPHNDEVTASAFRVRLMDMKGPLDWTMVRQGVLEWPEGVHWKRAAAACSAGRRPAERLTSPRCSPGGPESQSSSRRSCPRSRGSQPPAPQPSRRPRQRRAPP